MRDPASAGFFFGRERPVLAYSVEKLRITIIRKFKRIFQSPGAQVKDQLCRSELRQAGFSCDFYYPLVTTVRNDAQIANGIAALCKTEFFNRIDPNLPFMIARIRTDYVNNQDLSSGEAYKRSTTNDKAKPA